MLHRGSSGHVAGCRDVYDLESSLGFSVVMHELQVIAGPRAGGVFSWKKVSYLRPGILESLEQGATRSTLWQVRAV